jgi:hypothetical protein
MAANNGFDPLEFDLDLTKDADLRSLETDPLITPGWHHVVVETATYIGDKSPCIKLGMRILESEHKSQIGLRFGERFYMSERALSRLKVLAGRLGMVKDADCGKTARINWADAVGKQLVVRLTNEDYEKDGKTTTSNRLGYMDFYPTHDARVADKPKSAPAIENPKSVLKTPPAHRDEGVIDDLDGI